MPHSSRISTGNRLLDALPKGDLSRVVSHLEPVSLPVRRSLHAPGQPINDIYFLTEGMMSMVALLEDGASVEVGIVGSEGFVGIPALLGAVSMPQDAYMQIAGVGHRMPAAAMREEVERSPAFKEGLFRYAQFFLTQVSQTAACNARHPLEVRLARWLLMAHDRIGSDELPLTQEFLSIMLGVQRPGVSLAAGALQKAGLIQYSHGRITVLDRAGLEDVSCECYRIVKNELDRLFR
jgi:CRP-like cAMP-binding protein